MPQKRDGQAIIQEVTDFQGNSQFGVKWYTLLDSSVAGHSRLKGNSRQLPGYPQKSLFLGKVERFTETQGLGHE